MGQDDEGASAVLVAVALVVLLGVTAIVIDVGNLTWERRMLQNSADAAALAVAQDCAAGDCGAEGVPEGTATEYALANNRRGAHVEGLDIDEDAGEVAVVTHSGDQDGDVGFVQNWFIQLLAPSQAESAVRARAMAAWEPAPIDPDLADLPVAASVCDFMEGYEGGTIGPEELDAYAREELPTIAEAEELIDGGDLGQIVSLHRPNDHEDESDECTVDPGFSTEDGDGAEDPNTMPGGFGYLEDDGACGVEVDRWEDDGTFWASGEGGTSPDSASCIRDYVGTVVTIPVFIELNRDDREYRLYAPAAFYLTGARVVGGGGNAEPPGFQCPAGAEEWCMRGHFVQDFEEDGEGTTPDTGFGVFSVRLVE